MEWLSVSTDGGIDVGMINAVNLAFILEQRERWNEILDAYSAIYTARVPKVLAIERLMTTLGIKLTQLLLQ